MYNIYIHVYIYIYIYIIFIYIYIYVVFVCVFSLFWCSVCVCALCSDILKG